MRHCCTANNLSVRENPKSFCKYRCTLGFTHVFGAAILIQAAFGTAFAYLAEARCRAQPQSGTREPGSVLRRQLTSIMCVFVGMKVQFTISTVCFMEQCRLFFVFLCICLADTMARPELRCMDMSSCQRMSAQRCDYKFAPVGLSQM